MTFEAFQKSLAFSEPPDKKISVYLKALWYDAKGDWNKAHDLIQDLEDGNSAWIHAYLHRKEGDQGNADYWYRRAHKTRPDQSLQREWETLVKALSD